MRMKTGSILLGVLWLALSGARAPAQDLGTHFRTVKDGIHVYAAKPVDSNCTVILTQEGVVLIDSGHNPPDSHAVMKAVRQLTSQPVRLLINTEPHADHTSGHFVFSPPAIIVAAAGAGDSMRAAENPRRWEPQALGAPGSAEMRAALEGYRLITPHVEYRDKMTLNVGERTFELYYLKNVHSESDTAIWLPKERVLFAAASVSVKRFNNLRPFVSIADTLDAMERYYVLLVDRVKQMVAQGKTLEQIKAELKMPEADDWVGRDRYPNNIEAASCREGELSSRVGGTLNLADLLHGVLNRHPPRLAPQQEQPGADHDRRADQQARRRHVAPDGEAEDDGPHQREVIERHHCRGRRHVQRARPPILRQAVAGAAERHHQRVIPGRH